MDSEVVSLRSKDRSGEHQYSVRILHEFGKSYGLLTPAKVSQIWAEVSKHPVLFSDHTQGQAEPFLIILFNAASVWLELVRETDQKLVGVIYISHVIPGFDAKGHFVVFDSIASGRERIFHEVMRWMIARYNLRRISAETPPYQSGVMRFIEKGLKMKPEGVKREAVIYRGQWYPLKQFGITRDEVADVLVGYDQDVQELNTLPEAEDGSSTVRR